MGAGGHGADGVGAGADPDRPARGRPAQDPRQVCPMYPNIRYIRVDLDISGSSRPSASPSRTACGSPSATRPSTPTASKGSPWSASVCWIRPASTQSAASVCWIRPASTQSAASVCWIRPASTQSAASVCRIRQSAAPTRSAAGSHAKPNRPPRRTAPPTSRSGRRMQAKLETSRVFTVSMRQ